MFENVFELVAVIWFGALVVSGVIDVLLPFLTGRQGSRYYDGLPVNFNNLDELRTKLGNCRRVSGIKIIDSNSVGIIGKKGKYVLHLTDGVLKAEPAYGFMYRKYLRTIELNYILDHLANDGKDSLKAQTAYKKASRVLLIFNIAVIVLAIATVLVVGMTLKDQQPETNIGTVHNTISDHESFTDDVINLSLDDIMDCICATEDYEFDPEGTAAELTDRFGMDFSYDSASNTVISWDDTISLSEYDGTFSLYIDGKKAGDHYSMFGVVLGETEYDEVESLFYDACESAWPGSEQVFNYHDGGDYGADGSFSYEGYPASVEFYADFAGVINEIVVTI